MSDSNMRRYEDLKKKFGKRGWTRTVSLRNLPFDEVMSRLLEVEGMRIMKTHTDGIDDGVVAEFKWKGHKTSIFLDNFYPHNVWHSEIIVATKGDEADLARAVALVEGFNRENLTVDDLFRDGHGSSDNASPF